MFHKFIPFRNAKFIEVGNTNGVLDSISEALKNMNKESITSFFVTKKSKPIGIIHLHDILKY